jgi:hypothetical protein
LEAKGLQQVCDPNAVFDLKFLNELAVNPAGNFKLALAHNEPSLQPGSVELRSRSVLASADSLTLSYRLN